MARRRAVRRLAEVGGQQPLLVVVGELVVDREVAEIEPAVAHAGVLPVDQVDAVVSGQEVRPEQVVVAGHRLVAGLTVDRDP